MVIVSTYNKCKDRVTHCTSYVKHLNSCHYPHRWTWRIGPVLWPQRSSDLKRADFFLRRNLKGIRYSQGSNTQIGRDAYFKRLRSTT